MKVNIEATQEEFNSKRLSLASKIAGSNYALVNKSEVKFTTPRRGRFKAQKEMLGRYDAEFKKMLDSIKEEVDEIIQG